MFERDVILREIGLTPIWTLRNANASHKSRDAPSTIAEKTSVSSKITQTAEAPQSTENSATRAARISGLDWDDLVTEISQCTACKLCNARMKTVPGGGNRSPDWMLVGASPGEEEDKRGEAITGRAGSLLDQMLAAVGKSRKDNVFVAHVVKCRPPANRTPEADEIAACAPYLARQIALANPKLFLALGKFAGQQMLTALPARDETSESAGQPGDMALVVMRHPKDLLTAPRGKAEAWEQLVTAKRLTS